MGYHPNTEKSHDQFVKIILFVEDDDALRKSIALGLELSGFTVYTASNGLEGIEVYKKHKGEIDLIISDVIMPKMNGPKMVQNIKKEGNNVEVIFVSGYNNDDDFQKNTANYDYKYLAKPFTMNSLISTIRVGINHSV